MAVRQNILVVKRAGAGVAGVGVPVKPRPAPGPRKGDQIVDQRAAQPLTAGGIRNEKILKVAIFGRDPG